MLVTSGVHDRSTADLRDLAALFVLGELSPSEEQEFESHLGSGCSVCAAEVRAFGSVMADLALACTPITPETEWKLQPDAAPVREDLGAGVLVVHSAGLPWQETGIAGIRMRMLHRDGDRARFTVLVQMDPGSAFPSHRHTEVEELYMLQGDIQVAGQRFGAGDYCRAEAGSLHGIHTTQRGCLFLAVASTKDEFVVA